MDVVMENQQLCLSQDPRDNIVRNVKSEEEEKEFMAIKEEEIPLQVSSDHGDSIVRNVKTEEEEVFVKKAEAVPLQISPDPGDAIVRNVKTEEELENNKKEEISLQLSPVTMDSMEEKIIELVRVHPEIYDTGNPNYIWGKYKQEIWDTIAKELNLSNGEEAKNFWRRLRNNHRDALRRQRRLVKSGAAAQPIKPWKFQDQMEFLVRYMVNENRDTHFNIDDDHPNPLSQEQSEASGSQSSVDALVDPLETSTQQNPTSKEGNTSFESSSSALSLKPTLSQKKNRAKKFDLDNFLKAHFKEREKRSKERSEERKLMEERLFPKEDLYLFFMSMYEHTKKMSPASQRVVKKHLFQVVLQEEERQLNFSQPTTVPQYQQMYPVYSNDQHIQNFPLPPPTISPSSSISTSSLPPSASSPGSMESYQGNMQPSNVIQYISQFPE